VASAHEVAVRYSVVGRTVFAAYPARSSSRKDRRPYGGLTVELGVVSTPRTWWSDEQCSQQNRFLEGLDPLTRPGSRPASEFTGPKAPDAICPSYHDVTQAIPPRYLDSVSAGGHGSPARQWFSASASQKVSLR